MEGAHGGAATIGGVTCGGISTASNVLRREEGENMSTCNHMKCCTRCTNARTAPVQAIDARGEGWRVCIYRGGGLRSKDGMGCCCEWQVVYTMIFSWGERRVALPCAGKPASYGSRRRRCLASFVNTYCCSLPIYYTCVLACVVFFRCASSLRTTA